MKVPRHFIKRIREVKGFLQAYYHLHSDHFESRLHNIDRIDWPTFYTTVYEKFLYNPDYQASDKAFRALVIHQLESTLED